MDRAKKRAIDDHSYIRPYRQRNPDLPSWIEDLEDTLECPVCLRIFLDPPVYYCENQHPLCSKCHQPLFKESKPCPICRGQLTEKRSFVIEKIIDKFPKTPCKFEGCSFSKADRELVIYHEIGCANRLVDCGLCESAQVNLSSLPEHLETVHKRAIFDMPYPGEMELEAPVGNSWKIQHVVKVKIPEKIRLVPADREQNRPGTNAFLTHDLTFLFNSLKTADNSYFFWVASTKAPQAAKNYKYTLKIQKSADKKAGIKGYLFSGTRSCVPCDISHQAMKARKCCLQIENELIQEATFGNDGRLEFRISIHPAHDSPIAED